MQIKVNLENRTRKDLARALGEILGREPFYNGAPSFTYSVGDFTIDRAGKIICPEALADEDVGKLTEILRGKGFVVEALSNKITISLPRLGVHTNTISKLEKLIASKTTVLKLTLETDDLAIKLSEDKISFPWFTDHGIEGEVDAYQKLVVKMLALAERQFLVTGVEVFHGNPKYTMRQFLVRLGFIGEDYQRARWILTRNLDGCSSWPDRDHYKKLKDNKKRNGGDADEQISQ